MITLFWKLSSPQTQKLCFHQVQNKTNQVTLTFVKPEIQIFQKFSKIHNFLYFQHFFTILHQKMQNLFFFPLKKNSTRWRTQYIPLDLKDVDILAGILDSLDVENIVLRQVCSI